MEVRKKPYVSYVPPASYSSPKLAQPSAKNNIKFSGTMQRVKNPKISQLESKIEDLKSQIKKDPEMLPEKFAEIEAEIMAAEWQMKSEPQTVDYLA